MMKCVCLSVDDVDLHFFLYILRGFHHAFWAAIGIIHRLRPSRIKRSQVMPTGKFGPTALNFGKDFFCQLFFGYTYLSWFSVVGTHVFQGISMVFLLVFMIFKVFTWLFMVFSSVFTVFGWLFVVVYWFLCMNDQILVQSVYIGPKFSQTSDDTTYRQACSPLILLFF